MSRYFGWINKQAYDFVFKKHSHKGWWHFYLGIYHICQLIPKYNKRTTYIKSWTVIVDGHIDKEALRMVHGFATRQDAIDYALLAHELTKENYRKYV
jgi:hypothetical protein